MLKVSKKIQKIFKDACKKTGRPEKVDLSSFPEDMRKQTEAEYMLKVITEAKNEGWKADWRNSNQQKWAPYLWFSPSGVCFDLSLYRGSIADAGRSARLCFKDSTTSNAAGIELTELYEIALNE